MEELLAYRAHLIDRLEKAAEEFCAACEAAQDLQPRVEGWSIHQLAVHTRDADKLVYGLRVYRTAGQDNPLFENFDQDAWMAAQYDPDEPLDQVLAEFKSSVLKLAHWLRQAPPEAWGRESRHAVMGSGFTLQTWAERGLGHVEGHLEEVKSKMVEDTIKSKKQKVKSKTGKVKHKT